MSTTLEPEVLSPESVIAEINKDVVPQTQVGVMLATLAPIVPRVAEYEHWSDALTVTTSDQEATANEHMNRMAADVRTAKDAIADIKTEAKRRHSLVCSFENFFLRIDNARLRAKQKCMDFNEAQKREAARLQAIVDEKARKERERQEELARAQREKEEAARRAQEEALRKAESAKNEEARKKLLAEAERQRKEAEAARAKSEERETLARNTFAPTIAPPPKSTKSRTEITVTVNDAMAFIRGCAARPELAGYLEINVVGLKKTRQNNIYFTAPGITFGEKQV